ncbi:hypothetical protein TNCV_2958741 [Trichonephila clavipes]|nr:hypothetical protein TNCV_2958741 [Trichonephila clavipes]
MLSGDIFPPSVIVETGDSPYKNAEASLPGHYHCSSQQSEFFAWRNFASGFSQRVNRRNTPSEDETSEELEKIIGNASFQWEFHSKVSSPQKSNALS